MSPTALEHDARDPLAAQVVRSKAGLTPESPARVNIGPLEKVYLIWLAGGSCDGCTVAVVGATNPPVEQLLAGIVPGLPKVELIHTLTSLESGPAWVDNLRLAEQGELDAPFVLVYEGSVFDEDASGSGTFMHYGSSAATGQNISSTQWLRRLAPKAAALIAIGSCAAWGGIPGAEGNPTGSMGVMDLLGLDYRSVFGVPVVNVPGCAPVGDNFMDTAAATLLFLQGLGPLPEFDELGRPQWLFGETVHRHCPRAGYYEEGVFAETFGEKECIVELGCWGPVVQCNISERGTVNGIGGCMQMGGICIGCTMPGFPDKFSPLFAPPPGSLISSTTSRVFGGFIRRFRDVTRQDKNATIRWDGTEKPSGWARHQGSPKGVTKLMHKAYSAYQRRKIGG